MNSCCDNPVILSERIPNSRPAKGYDVDTGCANCGASFGGGSITRRKPNRKATPSKVRWENFWRKHLASRDRDRRYFIIPRNPEENGATV